MEVVTRGLTFLAVAVLVLPALAGGALVQSFQQTGNLGLELAGAATGNTGVVSGTFTLSNVTPGPAVKAFVYANDWFVGNPLDLTFAGVPVGAVGPFANDNTGGFFNLFAYRWDVTPMVTGPGNHSFVIGQTNSGNQIAGAALVVVYNDPLAASTTVVTILDGAVMLGEAGVPEIETSTFLGQPAGATDVYVFTVSDDSADSGEIVTYNGANIGGPIDQFLGFNASLLKMSGTSSAGANNIAISTGTPAGTDHFGWLVAATEVPEPATLSLLAFGGLTVMRRKRR